MLLFSTGTLHNHMTVWWAHELLQPVFFAALYWFVRRGGRFRWWQGAIVGFALSIITWTGVFASVGFGLYALYRFVRWRESVEYLWMLLGLAGGAATALLLIAGQALVLTGMPLSGYGKVVFVRAHERSPWQDPSLLFPMLRQLIMGLVWDYGAAHRARPRRARALLPALQPLDWAVLFIASFPLIETLPLLGHDTVYAFGRLKWLLPAILAAALASAYFLRSGSRRRVVLLVGAYTVAVAFHVGMYWLIYSR